MWLALRFPHWPLDSRLGETDDGNRLVAEDRYGRQLVAAASPTAVAAGVRRGMTLADARLRIATTCVYPRQPAAEDNALARLAGWAWGYSSRVHVARADAAGDGARLIMEIGASLRLFGGRAALLAAIRADLEAFGYRQRGGVAATPAAALARARAPDTNRRQPLRALSLGCLDLATATAASLRASGLTTLGALLALPLAELARRYGPELPAYLARLRGERPHGLALYQPPARYRARHELVAPVTTTGALLFVVRRAVAELAAFVRGANASLAALTLGLVHESIAATRLSIRFGAPVRAAEHIERVLVDRLARTTLAAPVTELRLDSAALQPAESSQAALWPQHAESQESAWPAVLDRLRARLGEAAVCWLDAPASHCPERASAALQRPPSQPAADSGPPRPLWLLATPEPIDAPLCFIAGPERIETGWWEAGIRRDYFRALDADGRLLWVYRDLAADAPRYYLHGLFG